MDAAAAHAEKCRVAYTTALNDLRSAKDSLKRILSLPPSTDDRYAVDTRRRHSAEFKARMVAKVKAGQSTYEVGQQNRLSASLLQRWCREAGVRMRPKSGSDVTRGTPHSAATRKKAIAMIESGKTYGEVTQKLGVPKQTVYRWVTA